MSVSIVTTELQSEWDVGTWDTFKPAVHRIPSSGYIVSNEHQAIVKYSNISASPEYEGYISTYLRMYGAAFLACVLHQGRCRKRQKQQTLSAQAEMQTKP